MAKIKTYAEQSSLNGSMKLLGTENSASQTRNFLLSAILGWFKGQLFTDDQYNAIVNSNDPRADNPFATISEAVQTLDDVLTEGNTAYEKVIGVQGVQADWFKLANTPDTPMDVGIIRWNDNDGAPEVGLKGGNVVLQLGQETVARVVNKTGANLLESEFKVVRIGTASGNRPGIYLAQANSISNVVGALGVVTENIGNNQEGYVTTFGFVRGINTSGWAEGTRLYLSIATAGGLTDSKPNNPDSYIVPIAVVTTSHSVNGEIYVNVGDVLRREPLSYKVRVNQSGGDDPTVFLIENYTDSSFSWTRNGSGEYYITCDNPLFADFETGGLTIVGITGNVLRVSSDGVTYYIRAVFIDEYSIAIFAINPSTGNVISQDGILSDVYLEFVWS